MGESVPLSASIDFASTLFAANIPNARNSIAVLSFAENCAATTVVKVRHCVDTFIVAAGQGVDSACSQTFRAETKGARAEFSLVMAAMSSIVSSTGVGGSPRWLMGSSGGMGTTATRATGVSGVRPVPTVVTLRRGKLMRRLVRNAASLLGFPRPIAWALVAFRRVLMLRRSSKIKTAILGLPSELRV